MCIYAIQIYIVYIYSTHTHTHIHTHTHTHTHLGGLVAEGENLLAEEGLFLLCLQNLQAPRLQIVGVLCRVLVCPPANRYIVV